MKKKTKNITVLTTKLSRYYSKLVKNDNPELHKRIQNALKSSKKGIETHFKKDKWDLNYGFYKDDLMTDIFGSDIMNYIEYTLLDSNNYHLRVNDKGIMLAKTNKSRKSKSAKSL